MLSAKRRLEQSSARSVRCHINPAAIGRPASFAGDGVIVRPNRRWLRPERRPYSRQLHLLIKSLNSHYYGGFAIMADNGSRGANTAAVVAIVILVIAALLGAY